MGRRLRSFTPNAVYSATIRTVQERFLLRPGDKLRETINGIIAQAQELFPAVRLFAYAYLSNHAHLLLASTCGQQMTRFLSYINGRVAREAGRMYGWIGRLWSRRVSLVEVVDDAAIIERFRYILAQGVKEGLVASPREWPGASAVPGLLGDMRIAARAVERDRETRARRRGRPQTLAREVTVVLSSLPMWAHLDAEALVERHRAVIAEIEEEAKGRPVLGAARVQRANPHDRPRASKHSNAPACHASSEASREAYDARYRRGVDAYRPAAVKYRAGAALDECGFPAGFFVGTYCIPEHRPETVT
jgi:hypothetical protein